MKQFLNRWLDTIRRDKRQAGLVLSLTAVGLLLWGRLLLKQVPQTASADEKPTWLEQAENELVTSSPVNQQLVELAEPPTPTRDPFLLDPNHYKIKLSEDSGLKQAKSEEQATDEMQRMAVVKAAAGLRLQSITQGEVPAAFINGRLIRLGGSIEGFTLLSCDERSAVLEKHGTKVRLGMGARRIERHHD